MNKPLITDYQSRRKSFTITGLVISFLCVFALTISSLFLNVNEGIFWAVLTWHVSYIALYWNKRVKAGVSGVEFNDSN